MRKPTIAKRVPVDVPDRLSSAHALVSNAAAAAESAEVHAMRVPGSQMVTKMVRLTRVQVSDAVKVLNGLMDDMPRRGVSFMPARVDDDSILHEAWAEFVGAKFFDRDGIVEPPARMREVDSILFDRPAETLAGVAVKLRATLYAVADEEWIEQLALGKIFTNVDEDLRTADIVDRGLWSVICTMEAIDFDAIQQVVKAS